MAWARLDDGFHDHPKVLHLLERGSDGLAAVGLWTVTRTWTARHNTGFISERTASKVAGVGLARTRKLAGLLLDVGLFDPATTDKAGWNLHDANGYSAEALSAKRSEAGKKGAESRWGAERGTDGNSHAEPIASANGKAEVANGKPDGKANGNALAPTRTPTRAQPVPSLPDQPNQPDPSSTHLHDDDSPNAPTGQASSSSKTPTQIDIEQLAAAIAADPAIGPGTDWTQLEPDAIGRIARWLDTHGQPALIAVARTQTQGRPAPASPAAWFSAWDQLRQTPPAATTTCSVHDLDHPTGTECRSCRADRLAGEPSPTRAAPGAPMPADLRDSVRAQLSTTTATNTGNAATIHYDHPPDQPPDEPQAAPAPTEPKTPAPAAAAAWPDEPPF